MKKIISITLTTTLIQQIDQERGLISRSAYIEYLLTFALNIKENLNQ